MVAFDLVSSATISIIAFMVDPEIIGIMSSSLMNATTGGARYTTR